MRTHLPINTSIRNRNTVLELIPRLSFTILLSSLQVGLDHHTRDTHLTLLELLANGGNNLWLVHMVLLRVSVRAINHDRRVRVVCSLLSHVGESGLDVFFGEVGSAGSTSENDVYVLVAVGLDDGGESLAVDTHEAVGVFGGSHGVDGDAD
jgi:hypothetical protein